MTQTFVDLGMSPLANSYIRPENLGKMEPFYPLHVFVCVSCLLVQLEEFESPEHIFSDYLYFSSFSETWLDHAKTYVEAMSERLNLGSESKVVEIGSNDGYLLQYFHQRDIAVLGVEPAANVAKVAMDKGIRTEVAFFGAQTAERLRQRGFAADLLAANNVLAHVPDLNDFVRGMKILLKPEGTITVEVPHLERLMAEQQFDTIYHEHFSYFSLRVMEKVFSRHGLTIFDVEQLTTHGGSLRIFARHAEDEGRPVAGRVEAMRVAERAAGLDSIETYGRFADAVVKTKCDILRFLLEAKGEGKRVVGYGAPAKGNTLLNFVGVGKNFIDFTVDRSPHKQGHYLPGTHIPIRDPSAILEARPAYVFILPWNLKDEIMEEMSEVRSWGGRFVIPIPSIQVIP